MVELSMPIKQYAVVLRLDTFGAKFFLRQQQTNSRVAMQVRDLKCLRAVQEAAMQK